MKINPITAKDFYKTGHIFQYPEGTEMVYSNFTPRSNRLSNNPDCDGNLVFFGLQGVIKWFLIDLWNEEFFNKPKEEVVGYYKRRLDTSLGSDSVAINHIEALHDLGYLPLEIKALPEGSIVPMKVPVFTVKNTHPEFFWLTNMLETSLSSECWKSSTTATTAYSYRKLLEEYADKTGSPREFIDWQGHDFSMRGLSGIYDASQSGSAHLLSFTGTDTISAIDYLENYYNANAENELIGGSVPATEHSVMCMGGKDDEVDTFKRIITELYPSGVVSIVSDTWDFWNVITNTASILKEEILSRKQNAIGLSKVVFRPDSGNPVKVICGYTDNEIKKNNELSEPEIKGAVECLWDIFGGTVNDKGYKVLDQHVGLIYGDSITLKRAKDILSGLEAKGFASCNIVFGIGSYTYQYVTRDTYGFAMKATYGVVNGEGREIFKDPITDSGTKKSAKGFLRVERENGKYVLYDQQTVEQEKQGCLETVFLDGALVKEQSLAEIRNTLLNK